jgi:hypothetical protein
MMALSATLHAMAGEVVLASPDLSRRLIAASLEARKLERFVDEVVADAQADEMLKHGLRPIGEVVETLLERGLRLASIDGPLRT